MIPSRGPKLPKLSWWFYIPEKTFQWFRYSEWNVLRCTISQKRGNRHRGRRSKFESVWDVVKECSVRYLLSTKRVIFLVPREIMEGRVPVQMVKRPSHLLPHLRIPYLNYSMAMQRPCGCHQARMGQTLPCLCVIPPASPSQHPRFGLSCPRVSAFHQTLRSLRREFPYGRLATPPSRYSVTCCTATKYGVK